MLAKKIAVIGAASASFGLNTLLNLLYSSHLHHSTIMLIDTNEEILNKLYKLGEMVNKALGNNITLQIYADLDNFGSSSMKLHLFRDVDFIVCAIEVQPREQLWRSDFEIPLKYGVRQPYAENSGPGGFAHALRNITQVMKFVKIFEKYSPNAIFINFTNPMIRICDAINRYSNLKVVGLCHQYKVGYAMIGKTLSKELQIKIPQEFKSTEAKPSLSRIKKMVAFETAQHLRLTAAGINHFTWMFKLQNKKSGENMYDLFTQQWNKMEPEFEPLTRALFKIMGVFPISGDEHLSEYLPWMSDPMTQPWKKYRLSLYEWDSWSKERINTQEYINNLLHINNTPDSPNPCDSEGVIEIIEGFSGIKTYDAPAINTINNSSITNLPTDAIIEIPAKITKNGIYPEYKGSLPEPIAELCRRELTVSKLCVDAAITGDRNIALHSLLLDSVIKDINTASNILEDYLEVYKFFLPQFWL